MRRHVELYALTGLATICTASGVDAQGSPAHPPRMGPEFFNPVQRSHSVEARCTGNVVRVSWSFDGERAAITEFTLDGSPLHADDAGLVDQWVSELGGDFFVWVACGSGAASFSLTQASMAGTVHARRVSFDLIDGRVRLVRKRP